MFKFLILACIASFVASDGKQFVITTENAPAPKPVRLVIVQEIAKTEEAAKAEKSVEGMKLEIVEAKEEGSKAEEASKADKGVEGVKVEVADAGTVSEVTIIAAPTAEASETTAVAPPPRADVTELAVDTDALAALSTFFQDNGFAGLVQSFVDALDLSSWAGVITQKIAGSMDALNDSESGLTIFVPTNEAFAAALVALDITASDLAADKPLLDTILAYHIIDGAALLSTDLEPTQEVTTQAPGQPALVIAVADGAVTITDSTGASATVVVADLSLQANVVFHVIDKVLVPIL